MKRKKQQSLPVLQASPGLSVEQPTAPASAQPGGLLASVPTSACAASSAAAYSAALLRALQASGVREKLLSVDALFLAAPDRVSSALQWPLLLHLLLLLLTEPLTPADLHSWVTAGLSAAQLASSSFRSSALARMLTPTERAFFLHVVRDAQPVSESLCHPVSLVQSDGQDTALRALATAHSHSAQLLISISCPRSCTTSLRRWEEVQLMQRCLTRSSCRDGRRQSQDDEQDPVSPRMLPDAAVPTPATDSAVDLAASALQCLQLDFSDRPVPRGMRLSNSDDAELHACHARWCPCFDTELELSLIHI